MKTKSLLLQAPPYPVEQALLHLGRNLRVARLRRNLTLEQVAEKIGTGTRVIADAEKGRLGTGIAVYGALLWTYGLLEPLADLADPAKDEEGQALDLARGRKRAAAKRELDNDF